jgi:prophage regulatory protein
MVTIMKRQEVVAVTGLCYTSIYNKEKAGNFPKRRQLSARSVGWIRQEVETWIQGLQCVVIVPVVVAPTA